MYTLTTHNIEVKVNPVYLPEKSQPFSEYHVFIYHISIVNNSAFKVQLVSRFWHIADPINGSKTVEGEGVVGYQPLLNPGQEFEYSSYTTIESLAGFMEGYFNFVNHDLHSDFKVSIPRFRLEAPYLLN